MIEKILTKLVKKQKFIDDRNNPLAS